MINALKQTATAWASKFITGVIVTGTALLILLKPGVSKANEEVQNEILQLLYKHPDKEYIIQENQNNDKTTYNFDQSPNTMDGGDDALSYAMANISYYPDMQNHLQIMIKSFRDQEHKDATIELLNKMVSGIDDPKQKTGAIIWALEYSVFYKSTFWDKYWDNITEQTFKHIEIFDTEYKTRFKAYYTRLEVYIEKIQKETEQLEKENEQLEKELIQWLQEIETIMNKFTPNDIQKSESIRNLVKKTKDLFISSKYTFSNHTRTLFNVIQ